MIVVVEGPSAAGKTAWCRAHAAHTAFPHQGAVRSVRSCDTGSTPGAKPPPPTLRCEVVVLNGDPCKLYYNWASWKVGHSTEAEWTAALELTRRQFVTGD